MQSFQLDSLESLLVPAVLGTSCVQQYLVVKYKFSRASFPVKQFAGFPLELSNCVCLENPPPSPIVTFMIAMVCDGRRYGHADYLRTEGGS